MKGVFRIIEGFPLMAVSPSHYYWKLNPKLEFWYSDRTWYIRNGDRVGTFPSLIAAVRFCKFYIGRVK